MIGNLRLVSGLILTAFVVGHFYNHALGIVSLKAMNDALKYTIQPWREPVGEALLFGAVIVHVVLAAHALYRRRRLKMGAGDAAQLISGFLIPILLGAHVLGTRGIHEVYGVVEGYEFTLFGMWVPSTFYGILNLIALPVVWIHTCLGWHYWLRLKQWYQPLIPWALGIAVLFPTLALAGYISASLRVSRLSNSERWVERLFKRTSDQLETFGEYVATGQTVIWIGVPMFILALLAFRWIHIKFQSRNSNAKIAYRDLDFSRKHEVAIQNGTNLLDHFRLADIPHASVCGGRGRCSTCRIRIDEGIEDLPQPGQAELRVLKRINAPENVRLACQTVPSGPISVTALLKPGTGPAAVNQAEKRRGGEEQEVAILFADIRQFTKLSESRLPYDVAFLLNRYFAAMGRAIEESGGHIDKFIGDGVMALFGVDEPIKEGARKAITAAIRMSEELERLNDALNSESGEGLRIGIGIHSGTAIVGKMGYGRAVGLTAIGDVVNTANRLEGLTKEHGVQLIVSEKTIRMADMNLEGFAPEDVNIRGRVQPISVRIIESAKDLGKPSD